MADIEISKILSSYTDTELKEEHWFARALVNLNTFLNRDNEILQERLAKVEKEWLAQKMLKNKVQTLKKEIQDLNVKDKNGKSKISELKSLLNETDEEIRRKEIEEKKLKQHYESRRMELGKLEKVKSLLQKQQSLYDNCLNTQLCCEGSDIFKLSFVSDERSFGWIKFKYDDVKNQFKIVAIDPKELVSESILKKFHETQDTQGLLCYIYQNLVKS